jgi:hypothetical protein
MKNYHLRDIAGKPVMMVMGEKPTGPPIKDKRQYAEIMAKMRAYMNEAKWPVFPNIKRAANAAAKVIEYYERKENWGRPDPNWGRTESTA